MLIPHLFRFIALEIYSAVDNGNVGGSVDMFTTLIYGDVITAILAIISLWALKLSWSFAMAKLQLSLSAHNEIIAKIAVITSP